jgi:hypothetical protein
LITVEEPGQGALWLADIHEIVPVPEPIHYALAVFGLVFGCLRAARFYLARRKATQ